MTSTYLGDFDQARQYAQRALEAAQHCQDIATQGMAYHLLAFVSHFLGHYTQGLAHGRQAVALLETTEEWHWLGMAYWDVGLSAIYLGAFITAWEALAHIRSLGEAHEDKRLLHMAEVHIGMIHTLRGEWGMGVEAYQRVLANRPDPVTALVVQLHLGHAYLEQGQLDQAIPLLTQVVQRLQKAQFRGPETRAAAFLAQALLLHKCLEPAQHMAQQALHIGQEISYPHGVALAQRVLGRIAQAQGDDATAEQYLHAALDAFNTLEMRYEQARTHLLLAQLAHPQGHREALSTHLWAAHHLFQTLQVPNYVACTERLARACGVALS
jgi:tetratricopeptide (TPR) repeat protein